MGLLNDSAAAVWRAWQAVSGRSTFQLTEPETPTSRIIYVHRNEAGVRVNEDSALTYGAVFSCVRIIAETLGALTWHVFRALPNGGKERLTGMNEYLLRDQPNPETTAFAWREQMVASALIWGGGYSEIVRDGAGRAAELWQIPPNRVQVRRVQGDGRLVYEIDNGTSVNSVLERDQVFHLHGLGFDGVTGYSVVRLAARSIGIGMAADQFAASFYRNGTWIGGVLETEQALSTTAYSNLKTSWTEMHRGPDKAMHPAILEQGVKYHQLGMPMTDAQFLESRRFQITDVARWFRVPPHKLADLERATFSNIEHQSLEFVQDTILPWAIRLEQEANAKMFGANRLGLFTKLNLNSLLRGDIESRYKAYVSGRSWGWLSANDVRELEDMNPIGPQGDVYLAPMNMSNAKKFVGDTEGPVNPAKAAPSTPPDDGEDDAKASTDMSGVVRAAHRELLTVAWQRVARREARWVEAAKRRHDGAELSAQVMAFLSSSGHQEYARDQLAPAVFAFARIVFAGEIDERVTRLLHQSIDLTLGGRLVTAQAELIEGTEADATKLADLMLAQVISLRMTLPAAA